tara:strand:- start:377 stop:1660 length:1284 start_codon:yes stop_codon:yes gene_type:complete
MPDPKYFKGKNGLSAKKIFDSRNKYNKFAYAPFLGEENLISLIDSHETILYGLVDKDFSPIQPKKERLSSYKNPDGSVFYALDFVVDSFINFVSAYNLGIATGKASSAAGDLSAISVKKAKPDTSPFLKKQIDSISKEYINKIYKTQDIRNIITVRDFLDHYMKFLLEKAVTTTITYSSFITSKYNDLNFNGLCLDISDASYSIDKEKVEKIINNKNFSYYRDTAKSFGFLISKKYPFKLIANLNSPQMRDRICVCAQEYSNGLDANNIDQILETYYEHPFEEDLNYLFNFLQISYNNLANKFPRQLQASIREGCLIKKQYFRKVLSLSEFKNILDDNLLLSFYIKIKNIESKLNFTEDSVQSIIMTAIDIKNEKDLQSALVYINSKFRMPSQVYGSLAAKNYYNTVPDANMNEVIRNSRFNRYKIF